MGAEGFDIGQVRHLGADPVEVVQLQRHPGFVRDGQQVQHRVGGPAEGHHHCDRVLKRRPGEDLASGDAALDELDHGAAAGPGEPVAAPVHRRGAGRARQRHAQRLSRAGHRIGGEHAGAGTLTWADRALHRIDFSAADPAA